MTGVFEIDTETGPVRVLWFFDDEGDECGPDAAATCVGINSDSRMVLIDMKAGEMVQ